MIRLTLASVALALVLAGPTLAGDRKPFDAPLGEAAPPAVDTIELRFFRPGGEPLVMRLGRDGVLHVDGPDEKGVRHVVDTRVTRGFVDRAFADIYKEIDFWKSDTAPVDSSKNPLVWTAKAGDETFQAAGHDAPGSLEALFGDAAMELMRAQVCDTPGTAGQSAPASQTPTRTKGFDGALSGVCTGPSSATQAPSQEIDGWMPGRKNERRRDSSGRLYLWNGVAWVEA